MSKVRHETLFIYVNYIYTQFFRKGLGAFKLDGVHPERRRNSFSPTPSMMSTYTVDEEGIARRKIALRSRRGITADEILFDSKDFFQSKILN